MIKKVVIYSNYQNHVKCFQFPIIGSSKVIQSYIRFLSYSNKTVNISPNLLFY